MLNELSARSVLLVTDKAMVKFGLAERVTALLRQRGIARQMGRRGGGSGYRHRSARHEVNG